MIPWGRCVVCMLEWCTRYYCARISTPEGEECIQSTRSWRELNYEKLPLRIHLISAELVVIEVRGCNLGRGADGQHDTIVLTSPEAMYTHTRQQERLEQILIDTLQLWRLGSTFYLLSTASSSICKIIIYMLLRWHNHGSLRVNSRSWQEIFEKKGCLGPHTTCYVKKVFIITLSWTRDDTFMAIKRIQLRNWCHTKIEVTR